MSPAARAACAIVVAGLAAGLGVSGCATRPPPAPEAEKPPAAAEPALDGIHRGLGPMETLWHLRAGLNVAALSCEGHGGAALAGDYNGWLQREGVVLRQAYDAKVAWAKAEAGVGWQQFLDRHMTRLYNHFAWPPAQPAFCREAAAVLRAALAPGGGGAVAMAGPALRRIDAPIVAALRGPSGAARDVAAVPPARTGRGMAMGAGSLGAAPAGWTIQLGAFTGQRAAEAAWALIAGRSAAIAGFRPHYEPVPGRAPLVRLRVGGLSDRGQAVALCAHAAAVGFECLPVMP